MGARPDNSGVESHVRSGHRLRAGVPPASAKRIALLGECLIELNGEPFGPMHQSFGGDTLNTAVYLARLMGGAVQVQYVTAVGTDALSDEMLRRWRVEGIETSVVLRDPTRLPGLYLIQVDERGERSFLYWRRESAARHLLRHPDFERVTAALAAAEIIYVTGISLAILPSGDRARLVALLARLAARGRELVLDSNYRAALWSSSNAARSTLQALLPSASLLLTTFNDEQQIWRDDTVDAARERLHAAGARALVIKCGPKGCVYSDGSSTVDIAAPPVAGIVDTTAAGDAFNAAFLAGRLTGLEAQESCRLGNALAGIVIQHRGAIIPAAATPALPELLERIRTTGVDQ
jgi:2-dehydro-3-deoxygluconokinase